MALNQIKAEREAQSANAANLEEKLRGKQAQLIAKMEELKASADVILRDQKKREDENLQLKAQLATKEEDLKAVKDTTKVAVERLEEERKEWGYKLKDEADAQCAVEAKFAKYKEVSTQREGFLTSLKGKLLTSQ